MTTPGSCEVPPPEGGLSGRSIGPQTSVTIGVFAKHWTPGATKTRLAASIGPDKAAAVSHCFVETILARLSTLSADDYLLSFSPPEEASEFASLSATAQGPWRCEPQVSGSLGDRMEAFFGNSRGAVVLVGSDSPNMPLTAVREAIEWLQEPDIDRRTVLGPTSDGGYWLIGVRGNLPPVFADMPWSETSLLAATKARLDASGWAEGTDYRLLQPWYDVDEVADLARLRQGLPDGDPHLLELAKKLDALLDPN